MLRFVVRRLVLLVPILLGLSILVFMWIRALPGGPAEALLGERATPATVAQIRHRYGLDKPITTQYWSYLKTTAQGDLGVSIASRRSVRSEIGQRFPATVQLALAAMIVALGVGIPLGFFAAKWHGSWFDHLSLFISLIGISIPIFFLAVILKYVFAVKFGLLPSIGQVSSLTELEHTLGRDQASHPARGRARLDPARDRRADHAGGGPRRSERGLRSDRPRKGAVAGNRRPPARDAERDAPDLDDRRAAGRPPAIGRRSDRDRLRLPRDRQLDHECHLQSRLPGDPGRRALPGCRLRARQPDGGHFVCDSQPADPVRKVLVDVDR